MINNNNSSALQITFSSAESVPAKFLLLNDPSLGLLFRTSLIYNRAMKQKLHLQRFPGFESNNYLLN